MFNQKKVSREWEQIHRDLLEAPKFGNDDDYVDSILSTSGNTITRPASQKPATSVMNGSGRPRPSPLTGLLAEPAEPLLTAACGGYPH